MKNQTSSKTTFQKRDLISHFELIAEYAEDSGCDFPDIPYPEDSVLIASEFTGLNAEQTILFAVIFILSFENDSVAISDIARYLLTSNLKAAKNLPLIEQIEKKKLIRKEARRNLRISYTNQTISDISYNITTNVLEAIINDEPSKLNSVVKMDAATLLEHIYNLVDNRDDGEITYSELTYEVHAILKMNGKLMMVKKIRGLKLPEEEQILLLYLCRESLNGSLEIDLFRAIESITDHVSMRYHMRRSMIKGYSELMKQDIVKLQDAHFRGGREILLTEKGMEMLFDQDMEVIISQNQTSKDLIPCDKIRAQELFFDQKTQKELSDLSRIIHPDNFTELTNRLKENKMQDAFTVLFHGVPGCGKTQSAFSLAKESGRGIMMVDISKAKSMWYGESQKLIKEIFDNYRRIRDAEKVEPFLFFNEMDGLFTKRQNVDNSSVGQTENAIQNVLLQQLEDFSGILIATTNLINNLDSAFERRFLYKLAFSAPDLKIRTKIWISKIQYLTDADALKLAKQFTFFTGSNIENISKKVIMQQVLDGKHPDLRRIIEWCEQEFLTERESNKMGFQF